MAARLLAADADVCVVCGGAFTDVYYSIEDKVTLEKRHVCRDCEKAYPNCFVCGLPANTNAAAFVQLPDQRVLCGRDARTAVLQEDEGLRICREVRDGLDRLFSRFTSFPETNVTVGLVDRVHLLELFKLVGNDYRCPNVLGITESKNNHHATEYSISLMSALPRSWFEATCAHEYAHTWVGDHLARARKAGLSRDAEEGFCEWVSFLFMEALNDETQKAMILRNPYTRGQIDLFVAAYRSYGINEVLDWMEFGTDDQLSASDPGRIRKISSHRPAAPTLSVPFTTTTATPAPNNLVLKAIFWDQKRPRALVNDQILGPNEQAKVRIGNTNVLVRCLSVFPDAVQLQLVGTGQEQTLRLKSK